MNRAKRQESGVILLETMVALGILLVVCTGLMAMTIVATSTTENQGHLAARTAEYAQDKMEQLLALAWTDTVTDTTVFPACSPSTTPSCSTGTGLAIGGSSTTSSPSTGYVDYLDQSGNVSSATGNWFYIRVWQVSSIGSTVKQITVTVQTASNVGPFGSNPSSTVAALKTSPF